MKKIIPALFLLSIVLLAAIKLSLWYFGQQFIDAQIQQAKPFVHLTYESLETSFSGSVTIKKVNVFVPAINENIHIDSIKTIVPDFKSLFTIKKQLQENRLPASLTFLISGLTLNFDGKLMKILDNPAIERSPIEVISTLACGDVHRIGGDALSKMGYDKLVSDISINYNFNSHDKTLNYRIKSNLQEMSYINLSGMLHEVSTLDSLTRLIARFGTIELEIIDDSYITQKNRFCANQGKRNLKEYFEENNKQLKKYLSSYGISLGEGLLKAYRSILKTSGSVRIQANLMNLTSTEEIVFLEPNDLIQFIHLKLFVNDKRINEISLNIDKNKLIKTATSTDVAIASPEEIKKKQALAIKKYRPVSASNLRNHNGYRVKITAHSGKRYKGVLITKNPRRYEIVTRFRSGNVSYYISPDNIKKAEVFSWR